MRIVARGAVFDIVAAVRFFAEVFRFIVAVDAHFQNRISHKVKMFAAMHFVAERTILLGDRIVPHFVAEVTWMALAAGVHHVRPYLHLQTLIMAVKALSHRHGAVDGGVSRWGKRQLGRFVGRGRGSLRGGLGFRLVGNLEEKAVGSITTARRAPDDQTQTQLDGK